MKWKTCTHIYSDGCLWIEADIPVPANNAAVKGCYCPFIKNLFGMLLALSHGTVSDVG